MQGMVLTIPSGGFMELPNRKPTRLANYDYSNQNYYFVTICTHNKLKLFGDVNKLNALGEIVKSELLNIPNHFEDIQIDKYVIMPDHIHAIIVIIVMMNRNGQNRSLHCLPQQVCINQGFQNAYTKSNLTQKSGKNHLTIGLSAMNKVIMRYANTQTKIR